jgi:hypothetical protein
MWGGWINILITDHFTAAQLLDEQSNFRRLHNPAIISYTKIIIFINFYMLITGRQERLGKRWLGGCFPRKSLGL